jgi:hypothetical protein
MIDGNVPERLFDPRLQLPRQCRLAAAGSAVEKDDLAQFDHG